MVARESGAGHSRPRSVDSRSVGSFDPLTCGVWPTILPTHLTHLPHPTRFLGSVLIFQSQRTALHWAADKGLSSCVALLLEHGANLEATDRVREESEVVVRSWWWRERGGRSWSPAFR